MASELSIKITDQEACDVTAEKSNFEIHPFKKSISNASVLSFPKSLPETYPVRTTLYYYAAS